MAGCSSTQALNKSPLATASPCSPVMDVEIDKEEDEVAEASSQQQDLNHQHQNVTAESSAKRQRGKRELSVDASSSNPSASTSRKLLASKNFEDKEGPILSSAAKRKTPKGEAPTAKRSRSPVVPAISTELARNLRSIEMISVLFETPSGFAIFTMMEEDLKRQDALQNVWANFGADYRVEEFIWLREFREFKDKSCAINQDTGVRSDLTEMIMRWNIPGRKIAVGKHEYKDIPCLFDNIVMELMWGLKNLMHFLVPQEKMKLTNDDRLLMSQGLKMILNCHGFDVKPEMVNDEIIMMACILLDCEHCDVKNCKPLRLAGEHIKDVSGTEIEKVMFTPEEASKFEKDALKYGNRFNKDICLNVYNEMVEARTYIRLTKKALKSMPEMHELAIR